MIRPRQAASREQCVIRRRRKEILTSGWVKMGIRVEARAPKASRRKCRGGPGMGGVHYCDAPADFVRSPPGITVQQPWNADDADQTDDRGSDNRSFSCLIRANPCHPRHPCAMAVEPTPRLARVTRSADGLRPPVVT